MRPSPRSSSWFSWFGLLLLVGSSAALSGCVVRAQPQPVYQSDPYAGDYSTAYPQSAPPAPVAEYRPAPPDYGYMWIDGYWDWTGADWSWSTGYWAPPRAGYLFIAPQVVYREGRPVYYRGYWQGSNGYRDYNYRVQTQPAWRGTPTNQPAGAWRGGPPPQNGPSGAWRGGPANQGYAAPPPSNAGGAWRATPPQQTTSAPPPSNPNGAWRGATPPQTAPAPGWSAAPQNGNPPPPRGWAPGAAAPPAGGYNPPARGWGAPGTAPAPGGGWHGAGAPAPAPVTGSTPPPGGGGWTTAPSMPGAHPGNSGNAPPNMPGAHPGNSGNAGMPNMPSAHPGNSGNAGMPNMPSAHPAGSPPPMSNWPGGNAGQPVNRQPAPPSSGGWHTAPAANPAPVFGGASPHPNTASPGGGRPAPAPVQSAPARGWKKK
jgi:hypothetical protein